MSEVYGVIVEENQESETLMKKRLRPNPQDTRQIDKDYKPTFYENHADTINYAVAIGAPLLAGGLSFLLFRSMGRSASKI